MLERSLRADVSGGKELRGILLGRRVHADVLVEFDVPLQLFGRWLPADLRRRRLVRFHLHGCGLQPLTIYWPPIFGMHVATG